nr:hypothetical protein [Tanacetum cinerariifolium]
MEINTKDEAWFADLANYLVADIIPKWMTYQQKNKFFSDLKRYFWEETYLFKVCSDRMIRRCVSGPETQTILDKCHHGPIGGHYGLNAEAQALPANDARVVVTFLKKLFCRFGMPKALINDLGTHLCNIIMEKTMKRYGVNHRFSTSYHPQTSGQVENTNRALKRILKKPVKDNPAIWSRKLDDALWAFHTAYKTPTGATTYKLIYGKNCHLPFEIEHRAYWALKNCNPDLIAASEKRMFQLHELDKLRHQAYANSRLYKARTKETYKNVSQDIHDQLNAEAEAVKIILTGIDNDIYSTVDACANACEMWKSIERNQFNITNHQVNVQFLLQLQPKWQRFVTLVKQSQELKTVSYHKLYDILKQHQNEVNEISAEKIAQPSMVAEDDETSKDKEIDKLMALISLSFKKIYKLTNNNLRTSSNTSRANQDNTPRINRGTGYENQMLGNVAGARETVEQSDWKDDTDDESDDQELEAHYMYMAKLQDVSPDADNSGPILDTEPVQEVQPNDNYNVFAIESEHPEQSESVHDTYLIEQDKHNVIIDSLDMSYDREQIDQNDDDADLVNERELLTSLIKKLKCEIDESKNRNKLLETSNKVLVEKLKGKLEDFKNKNKSLEPSNNQFKEANHKLSETNQLLYDDFKKSQAELKRRDSMEYASEMELECAKVRVVNNGNSKESFNKQTTLLEKRMDESIPLDKQCRSSLELFKVKTYVNTIFHGVELCKESIAKRTYIGYVDPFIKNTLETKFSPEIQRIQSGLHQFHRCLNEEMVADLRYFNSLELEVDSLISQLETQKTQFLNEIGRLSREYYYADHMNAILGVYTELDEVTNLQCDYLEMLQKCECLEKELSKSKMMLKSFKTVQKHAINLELKLQQCKEKIKNDKFFKVNQSNDFRKEREQYVKILDLKAQLHDKGIVISELKKLIEKLKGKSVDTKFEKSSVIR